jgi:hypothetical protein
MLTVSFVRLDPKQKWTCFLSDLLPIVLQPLLSFLHKLFCGKSG